MKVKLAWADTVFAHFHDNSASIDIEDLCWREHVRAPLIDEILGQSSDHYVLFGCMLGHYTDPKVDGIILRRTGVRYEMFVRRGNDIKRLSAEDIAEHPHHCPTIIPHPLTVAHLKLFYVLRHYIFAGVHVMGVVKDLPADGINDTYTFFANDDEYTHVWAKHDITFEDVSPTIH